MPERAPGALAATLYEQRRQVHSLDDLLRAEGLHIYPSLYARLREGGLVLPPRQQKKLLRRFLRLGLDYSSTPLLLTILLQHGAWSLDALADLLAATGEATPAWHWLPPELPLLHPAGYP